MNSTYFIDESGNTGPKWYQLGQPYFTYGGWLIHQDRIANANSFLQKFIQKEQCKELKSVHIFKRKDGLHIFQHIFNFLTSLECTAVPIASFTDKKFMIAAKIVETFFDPLYNPFVSNSISFQSQLKKALASCMCINNDILSSFAELIRNGYITTDGLSDVNNKMVEHFNANNLDCICESLVKLNNDNFVIMIDEFYSVTKGGNQKNYMSLSVPMLVELLKNVQIYCSASGVSANICHDSLRGMNPIFQDVKQFYDNGERPPIPIGGKIFASSFQNITDIAMKNSKSYPLLQAADLLCGFISITFEKIQNGDVLDEISTNILNELFLINEIFQKQSIKTFDTFISFQFEEKVYHGSENYYNIIKQEFPQHIK